MSEKGGPKNDPKNGPRKNRPFGARTDSRRYFWPGSAAEAGVRGGKREGFENLARIYLSGWGGWGRVVEVGGVDF